MRRIFKRTFEALISNIQKPNHEHSKTNRQKDKTSLKYAMQKKNHNCRKMKQSPDDVFIR